MIQLYLKERLEKIHVHSQTFTFFVFTSPEGSSVKFMKGFHWLKKLHFQRLAMLLPLPPTSHKSITMPSCLILSMLMYWFCHLTFLKNPRLHVLLVMTKLCSHHQSVNRPCFLQNMGASSKLSSRLSSKTAILRCPLLSWNSYHSLSTISENKGGLPSTRAVASDRTDLCRRNNLIQMK